MILSLPISKNIAALLNSFCKLWLLVLVSLLCLSAGQLGEVQYVIHYVSGSDKNRSEVKSKEI